MAVYLVAYKLILQVHSTIKGLETMQPDDRDAHYVLERNEFA
jgi:hypothetical protein